MTEQMDQAPEEKRPTAAELKAQIEDKQRELKTEAKGGEPVVTPEPIAPDQPEAATVTEPDKPTEPVGTSTVEAPAPAQDKPEDVPEIVKKKGWKSVDDMIESYRQLEKKLSEKRPDLYQQPPAPVYPQQPYGYPQPQVPNRRVEEYARQYGIAPEDFQRVVPLIGDLSRAIVSQEREVLRQELQAFKSQVNREKEVEVLKRHPAFQNPEVLNEMGTILDSNPRLVNEEGGLSKAFKDALANIGLRRLEGSQAPSPMQPSGPGLSTKPPVTARGTASGSNGSGPGIKAVTNIDPKTFSGLPLKEKQRLLEASKLRMKPE